jgi:hypothetical protein
MRAGVPAVLLLFFSDFEDWSPEKYPYFNSEFFPAASLLRKRSKAMLKKVSYLVFALCLVVGAMSFLGCSESDDSEFFDRQFIPYGKWESNWDDGASGGVDTYTIETGTLKYSSQSVYGNSAWEATIEVAVDFSSHAGVLIVKYTTAPSGSMAGHTSGKDYTGVYYTNYSSTLIDMGDAWEPDFSSRVETTTLNEALATFTEGNAGTHIGDYGTYVK